MYDALLKISLIQLEISSNELWLVIKYLEISLIRFLTSAIIIVDIFKSITTSRIIIMTIRIIIATIRNYIYG